MIDATTGSGNLTADGLKGRNVIDSRGTTIGEVSDVALDPVGWRVTGLVVNVSKDVADRLRLDRPLLGTAKVEFGAERIGSVSDNVILNVNSDEIAGAIFTGRQPGPL